MALISWKEKFIARWKVSPTFFNPKGIFFVHEGTPGENESGLMLVLRHDLDLVIPWKTVHKWEHFASGTLIQNLIHEWCGEVIFWIGLIQVSKFNAHMDSSLLIIYRNVIGYPFSQGNQIDKAILKQLLYLYLNIRFLMGIHRPQALSNRSSIWIGINLMFNNAMVYSRHFIIWPRKNISKFFK